MIATDTDIVEKEDTAVREGYKKTPVGWIPEGWEIKSLGEVGRFLKGKGISKNEVLQKGIPCVRYGEIYTTHNFFIKEFQSFVSRESANNSLRIVKGDLLFAGSGETLEDIGKCVAYLSEEEAYASGDIVILRGHKEVAQYLGFILNHNIVNRQTYKFGQGHSIVHIYASGLKDIKIPLPPLPEQRKIAEILSTWDRAIQQTQQLIVRLQERNRGLMQQLLTGKKRLPGFSGEWRELRLGQVFDRVTRKSSKERNLPVLSITANVGFVTQEDKFSRVIAGESLSTYTLIRKNEFSYNKGNSKSFPYGCIYKLSEYKEALVPKVYISFKPKIEINTNYYHFYFLGQLMDSQLRSLISSSARMDGLLNISPKDFFSIMISHPSVEEQDAIAQVLCKAIDEEYLYKNKLKSLKHQKKGLMQKLLTGEVRVKINELWLPLTPRHLK